MPLVKCKICDTGFYPRPSHVLKGWGVYCSRNCKHVGSKTSIQVTCFVCNTEIFKTPTQVKRSKSKKYFCSKSCQTKWRNTEFSGNKHAMWKGGFSMYRNILLDNKKTPKCMRCEKRDIRILAVHHVDENHQNNNLRNLAWLCHNCHYLVHHDTLEKQKFLNAYGFVV